eukprot:503859-Pyramimonas_sp.AAC.1
MSFFAPRAWVRDGSRFRTKPARSHQVALAPWFAGCVPRFVDLAPARWSRASLIHVSVCPML